MRSTTIARSLILLVTSITLGTTTTLAASPQPFMTGAQWIGLYESGEAGKEAAAAYVAGYVDGIQSAEATARKKRFCVPDDITELELADIVAKYVAGKSVFRQMGAPFVIDGALKDVYRC